MVVDHGAHFQAPYFENNDDDDSKECENINYSAEDVHAYVVQSADNIELNGNQYATVLTQECGKVQFLADTGSSLNLIHPDFVDLIGKDKLEWGRDSREFGVSSASGEFKLQDFVILTLIRNDFVQVKEKFYLLYE